ncbi:MAG TPA: triose-phosphate isomerase [Flavitalea sp.]|nr:triose-phosphate isomerase [Flavitalea sp.]
MRKQIAAANWKMNCTYQQAERLLEDVLNGTKGLKENHSVLFAVPFPYLIMANSRIADEYNFFVTAQNCSHEKSGAFTGEVSAEMLHSISIKYCIVGHSERREYFHETNEQLAKKIDLCLTEGITPVFCCGETLDIREAGKQNEHVANQVNEALFHLDAAALDKIIIAYEPVWAIGTGKTASADQAQEMHAWLRSVIAKKYGPPAAEKISVLYGGSVKAANAKELFSQPDIDGGLVGGASLVAEDFIQIIKGLST